MYKRLVVPLDGSDIAERALVEAEHLATLTHAPIHLVRVVDFSFYDTSGVYGVMADPTVISTMITDELDSARQYLESVDRQIADHGFSVSHELRQGSVTDQLMAASKPDDLYVMSSHGRHGISRWFLGSVAEDVVRRSTVPVLLVKTSSYTGDQSRSKSGVPLTTETSVNDASR